MLTRRITFKPFLIATMCLCFGAGLAVLSNSANGQAATAEQEEAIKAAQAEALKQATDAVFKELSRLIPGEVSAESPQGEGILTAAESFLSRNVDKSLVILEQQVIANPTYPPAKVLMAGMCFVAKDAVAGNRFLEQAAIESPNHPSVYAAYARIALATNRSVDALVHYEKLDSLLADSSLDKSVAVHYRIEYLDGMSSTTKRLKQYDEARKLIDQLLKLKPDFPKAIQLLAEIAFEEKKVDESLQHLTKLRELVPASRAPEAVIGTWYSRSKDQAKAIEWMNKIPAKYSDDSAALTEYASWSLAIGDVEAASDAIQKAEAGKEPSPLAKNIKGKIAFTQQKYTDAINVYKELYDSNPRNADFANMYALSLIESGDSENKIKANQLANATFKANPNNRVALAAVGYVRLHTLGVSQETQAIFQQIAKTRDGRSPEVDYFLANFLMQAGDKKSAAAVLQQANAFNGLFLYRKQSEALFNELSSGLATP